MAAGCALDGFWLPRALRDRVLAEAEWETLWLRDGAIVTSDFPGAVPVRWPRLTDPQWSRLIPELQRARSAGGREILARWKDAIDRTRSLLSERLRVMSPTLAACTGYSPAMIQSAFGLGEIVDPALLAHSMDSLPAWSSARRWERIPGLPGLVRFYPRRATDRMLHRLRSSGAIFRGAPSTDLALGFAAGNVPGTALMIGLLASLANYAGPPSGRAPAVLVRNSRHEPLFAPLVLSAIESVDPGLLGALALLVWDYQESSLQARLMSQAGLMIAAAGDDTIAALDSVRSQVAPALRFHRHGHKVSFAVVEADQVRLPGSPDPHHLALLSAVDSSMWDQNGCLSARVHFVAGDAEAYARELADRMRAVARLLPRGSTPRRLIHRAFDTHASLGGRHPVRLCSTYDDDFAVIVDARAGDPESMRKAVNLCMGRVIVVRPVRDVADVSRYLRWIPPSNLQSISVSIAAERVEEFATEAGACGVTALRSLGRAAFPQLAHSWDGLLPPDVACLRPDGHFTAIEFDDLRAELAATYERLSGLMSGAALGPLAQPSD
ncbi:MAG: acyl-CoA reductase [Acidobacteriota bacterium]